MIEQKYILLILNCYKNKAKAIIQKQTWLKNELPKNIIYYHILGNMNLEVEYKFDNNNKILYVKTPDDYISLPTKIITAYKAINETYKYEYIFKTDDDTKIKKIFFTNIINKLENSNTLYHYGGVCYINIRGRQKSSLYNRYRTKLNISKLWLQRTRYFSGPFYLLSNTSIEKLLIHYDKICEEYIEDYAMGLYLPIIYKNNVLNLKLSDNCDIFYHPH